MQNSPQLEIVRVRHPLKFRLLRVERVDALSPALVRVTLTGDLSDFVSASFDDHVKVFFPANGEEKPVLPGFCPDGIVFPEGMERPAARDYTPGRFDAHTNELDIEFAMHEAGPATVWARQAGSPTLLQAALADFVEQGHFARHLKRMRALYAERRVLIVRALEQAFGERLIVELPPGGIQFAAQFAEGPDGPVDDVALPRGTRGGARRAAAFDLVCQRRHTPHAARPRDGLRKHRQCRRC